MKYTKIPTDSFKMLQVNAAVAVKTFNPASPKVEEKDILAMTTGGFTFQSTTNLKDRAENFDNVPKGTKEFLELESRETTASTTFVTINPDFAAFLLAAADVDGEKITPRSNIKDSDFSDFWIVGDYSNVNDEDNGGYCAVHMMNVLSTGGFQWKTTDNGNGQFSAVLKAHYSATNMDKVPFEVYIHKGTEASS